MTQGLPDETRNEVRRLLVGLIKLALVGDGAETLPWRSDALQAQWHVSQAVGTDALDLHSLWTLAVKTAESDPVVHQAETVNPILPMMSPLGLPDLRADPFDLDAAVQRIRDAASFG